jgi:hypothetical protein
MAQPEIPEGQQAQSSANPAEVLVHEIPETPEVSQEVKAETGVSEVPSQFTQVIQDDSGKQLTTSPATQTITITLPATEEQLLEWAKGPEENAITWLAKFWLRMMKKAIQLGWKVVSAPFTGGKSATSS